MLLSILMKANDATLDSHLKSLTPVTALGGSDLHRPLKQRRNDLLSQEIICDRGDNTQEGYNRHQLEHGQPMPRLFFPISHAQETSVEMRGSPGRKR